jgi:CheY-like chemotaxis protein
MDDESSIRSLGTALLRRLGLEPTAVNDGAEAVRQYLRARQEGRPFDLVIFDLTVPGGMGGRQAMEQLRALDPTVKAIVSSGYSTDPVLADYRTHGFSGRVTKPYEVADMARTIHRVLRGERE